MDPTAIKSVTRLNKGAAPLSQDNEDYVISCIIAKCNSSEIIDGGRKLSGQPFSQSEERMIRLLEIVYFTAAHLRRTGGGPNDIYNNVIWVVRFKHWDTYARLPPEDQAMIEQLMVMLSCLGLGLSTQLWTVELSSVPIVHCSHPELCQRQMIRALYKLENELFRSEIVSQKDTLNLKGAMKHAMALEPDVTSETRLKHRNLFGKGDETEPDHVNRRYKKLYDYANKHWHEIKPQIPDKRTTIQSLVKAYHAGLNPAAPLPCLPIVSNAPWAAGPVQRTSQATSGLGTAPVGARLENQSGIKIEPQDEVELESIPTPKAGPSTMDHQLPQLESRNEDGSIFGNPSEGMEFDTSTEWDRFMSIDR